MASPYVCGPGHIWVGLTTFLYAEFLSLPGAQQAILQGGLGACLTTDPGISSSACAPPGSTQIPNSGSIVNVNYPLPSSLVQALVLAGRTPVYLGTAEQTPEIEIERAFLPWYDDEQGSEHPADEFYEGEQAWITADINKWNEPVYAFMAQIINNGGAPRGIDAPQALGTSVMMEGFTYPLWIQFPMAVKLGYTLLGMPGGYRFFNTKLVGPDRLAPISHEPSKRRLIWRAQRYLDIPSGVQVLYDHDMSQLGFVN